MKKLKNFIPLVCLLSTLYISCGDDVDCTETTLNAIMTEELTKISNAALDYTLDPSAANCTNYTTVLQAYVDRIAVYKDCPTVDQDSFQESLTTAQGIIDDLPC
jgi:hypothetical protein